MYFALFQGNVTFDRWWIIIRDKLNMLIMKKKINFQFLVFRFYTKLGVFLSLLTVLLSPVFSLPDTILLVNEMKAENIQISCSSYTMLQTASMKWHFIQTFFFVSLNNPLQPLMLAMILNIHLGQHRISWAWLFFIFAKGHYC